MQFVFQKQRFIHICDLLDVNYHVNFSVHAIVKMMSSVNSSVQAKVDQIASENVIT